VVHGTSVEEHADPAHVRRFAFFVNQFRRAAPLLQRGIGARRQPGSLLQDGGPVVGCAVHIRGFGKIATIPIPPL